MKITFLGVTGFPARGKQTIAFLIENKDKKLLFDCGTSIISQLESASCLMTDLDGIIVTHVHADHAGGIPLIFFANIMERFFERWVSKKVEVTIAMEYLTYEKYLPVVKSAYSPFFGDAPPAKVNLIAIPNMNESTFSVAGCEILTRPLAHSVPVIGCRIKWGETTVCYLSDTRPIAGLETFSANADLLVCNVFGSTLHQATAYRLGFMTANDAAVIAQHAGVKTLAIQHLFHYADDIELCRQEVQAQFDGALIIPQDGDGFDL